MIRRTPFVGVGWPEAVPVAAIDAFTPTPRQTSHVATPGQGPGPAGRVRLSARLVTLNKRRWVTCQAAPTLKRTARWPYPPSAIPTPTSVSYEKAPLCGACDS